MVENIMFIILLSGVYLFIGFAIAALPLDYDDPEEVIGVMLLWPIILVVLALIGSCRVIADIFNRR